MQPFAGVGRPFRSLHDDGGTVVEVVNGISGPALLALREDDSKFSGQFAYKRNGTTNQLQIVAVEEPCNDCCQCDGFGHCKLTFFDKTRSLKAVARTKRNGGNAVVLQPRDAARATFSPDTILCDDDAIKVIQRFFPKLAQKRRKDLIVNTGTLSIDQLIFTR